MYGNIEKLSEKVQEKLKGLIGISYSDWLKVREVIDISFKKKKGEAEKSLHLLSENELFNPF